MREVPETPEEKDGWREQRRRVHKLFVEEWDPIGVDDEEAEDEYAAYANAVVAKIRAGESDDDIAKYLSWVVEEYMGMEGAFDRRLTSEIIGKTREILR